MTTNRCINFIEEIDRESKQRERTARSQELLAAAVAEAIDNKLAVTLTKNEHGEVERFFVQDERKTVMLNVPDNAVFIRDARTPRYAQVKDFPETDVLDVVSLFTQGVFHK